jgi:hypothetical protein
VFLDLKAAFPKYRFESDPDRIPCHFGAIVGLCDGRLEARTDQPACVERLMLVPGAELLGRQDDTHRIAFDPEHIALVASIVRPLKAGAR